MPTCTSVLFMLKFEVPTVQYIIVESGEGKQAWHINLPPKLVKPTVVLGNS